MTVCLNALRALFFWLNQKKILGFAEGILLLFCISEMMSSIVVFQSLRVMSGAVTLYDEQIKG
jgi:hypothetical protein